MPATLTRTKSSIEPHSCTWAAVWTTSSRPSSAAARRLAVGDVRLDERRRPRRSTRSAVGRVDVEPQHLGALGGQSAADRAADEAAGSGDRGRATLEASRPLTRPEPILAAPCCESRRMSAAIPLRA